MYVYIYIYIICLCLARCLDMKMNVSEHLQAVLHNYKLVRYRRFLPIRRWLLIWSRPKTLVCQRRILVQYTVRFHFPHEFLKWMDME